MAAITERPLRARCSLIVAALLATGPAAAAEFTPWLLASETYTSNVTLAPPGLEESDWVTTLAPGFELNSGSTRYDFEVAYQMQSLHYASDSDRNESFHQADVISELDLWPNRFGVNFLGAYGQTIVDPREPIPFSNVATTFNRLDFATANLNPYLTFDLGEAAFLRLDYAAGEINYDDGGNVALNPNVDDVQRELKGFFLGSAEEQRFIWGFSYTSQRAEFDVLPKYFYERAGIELGLPLGGGVSIITFQGKESDVPVSRSDGGLDSRFWETGLRWDSRNRTTLEWRMGERFFGDTNFAEISHRGERLQVVLGYREDPTTLGLEQIGRRVVNLEPGDTSYSASFLTQELYINKQLSGQLRYQASRIEAILNIRDIEREYIETAEREEETQLDFDWFWRFGARSTIGFGLFAMDIGFRRGGAEDEVRQVSVRMDRETGSRSRLSFIVRRERRESNNAASAVYEEQAGIVEYTIFGPGQQRL
jgi:hypothetical protein